jgi:hypothetical protein
MQKIEMRRTMRRRRPMRRPRAEDARLSGSCHLEDAPVEKRPPVLATV